MGRLYAHMYTSSGKTTKAGTITRVNISQSSDKYNSKMKILNVWCAMFNACTSVGK